MYTTRTTDEEVNSKNNTEDNPKVPEPVASANTEPVVVPVPGIQVVCAGLGRTGTLSLTEALKILGYKPYHFVDLKHAEQWAALFLGRDGCGPDRKPDCG